MWRRWAWVAVVLSVCIASHRANAQMGSVSLSLNRVIYLDHITDLPTPNGQREGNQPNGSPLPTFPFVVLSLFFIAAGFGFLRYGIYKSQEIGGHSFMFWLYGVLLIWLAVAIARVALG